MRIIFFTIIAWTLSLNAFAEDSYWIRGTSSYKGSVLLIHGLNFKPAAMEYLANVFAAKGYDALILKLQGHEGDLEAFKTVTREGWGQQVFNAYQRLLNNRAGGSLVLVGTSLGAQVAMQRLNHPNPLERIHFDRMLFFAPALSLQRKVLMTRPLTRVLSNGTVIPSMTPEEYRVHPGSTIAAYKALFEGLDFLDQNLNPALSDIPTHVFLDSEDEVVSFDGIKALSERLSHWDFVPVSNKGTTYKSPYHHLITEPLVLGEKEWQLKVLPILDTF